MRVTYHNSGCQKGAQIELTPEEALLLNRQARGPGDIIAAAHTMSDFVRDLLPKLDRAILHGDSEAEEARAER